MGSKLIYSLAWKGCQQLETFTSAGLLGHMNSYGLTEFSIVALRKYPDGATTIGESRTQ